jgi:glycosyltransferase involved in cell wall biosynthesis
MGPARRYVIYDDAYAFGGHEIMLCRLLRHLSQDPGSETLALFSEENRARLMDMGLGGPHHGNLRVEYLPFSNPRRYGNLAALLSPGKIVHVLRRLRAFAPDTVLAAQGGIDISMIGLLAARLGGYRTLSYIPNLNGYARTAPTRKNRLRDRMNRPFHRVPHEFVVIRRGHMDELRSLGFHGPVHVVYNAVDTEGLVRLDKADARAALGLPETGFIMGLIGRIDLANKGHDLVVRAMARHADAFAGAILAVIGEGPDDAALRDLVREQGMGERVRIVGFRKDLATVYSAVDLVLIPSRSEGVPLVMLEALHYGLPVAATAVDGMAEMLPPAWLFPCGDAAALAERVQAFRTGALAPDWDGRSSLLEQVRTERFFSTFLAALQGDGPGV